MGKTFIYLQIIISALEETSAVCENNPERIIIITFSSRAHLIIKLCHWEIWRSCRYAFMCKIILKYWRIEVMKRFCLWWRSLMWFLLEWYRKSMYINIRAHSWIFLLFGLLWHYHYLTIIACYYVLFLSTGLSLGVTSKQEIIGCFQYEASYLY